MMKIKVRRASAVCVQPILLTTGMVGAKASFTFDKAWSGLEKCAVFTDGTVTCDVVLTDTECVIPHEVLREAGAVLRVGVYGVNADGDMVIPTVYADCGAVQAGADPAGDESYIPAPDVGAQVMAAAANAERIAKEVERNVNNVLQDIARLKKEVFAAQDVTFAGSSGTLVSGNLALSEALVAGETYTVIWDGTVFTCQCYDKAECVGSVVNAAMLGNASIFMSDMPNTGEPFFVLCGNTPDVATALTKEGESHKLAIYGKTETVGIQSVEQTTAAEGDGAENVFTVTLTDGSTSDFVVKNGSKGSAGQQGAKGTKGDKGESGEAGGYYVPSVTQPDANTIRVSFAASKTGMSAVGAKDIALPRADVTGFATMSDVEDYVQQYVSDNLPGGTTAIYEEQNAVTQLDPSFGYFSQGRVSEEIEIGRTYRVVLDGKEYICVAENAGASFNNQAFLGNGTPFGLRGNGEPFVMLCDSGSSAVAILYLNDTSPASSHAVAIHHTAADVLGVVNFVKSYVEQYISEALGGDY